IGQRIPERMDGLRFGRCVGHRRGVPGSADSDASTSTPYTDPMTTLFVSDLHLDPERPAITELFGRFVGGEARGADALYVLGDLFEAWVGDDDPSATGAIVADAFRALRDSGVPVYFMRGNRDFL